MKEGGFSKGKLANHLTAYTADNEHEQTRLTRFHF